MKSLTLVIYNKDTVMFSLPEDVSYRTFFTQTAREIVAFLKRKKIFKAEGQPFQLRLSLAPFSKKIGKKEARARLESHVHGEEGLGWSRLIELKFRGRKRFMLCDSPQNTSITNYLPTDGFVYISVKQKH